MRYEEHHDETVVGVLNPHIIIHTYARSEIRTQLPINELNKVKLLVPDSDQKPCTIGIIRLFSQNHHQLLQVPLFQPKLGTIWSLSQNYHQVPEVLQYKSKIGIIDKLNYSWIV